MFDDRGRLQYPVNVLRAYWMIILSGLVSVLAL